MKAESWTLRQTFEACSAQEWGRSRNASENERLGELVLAHFGAETPLGRVTTERIDAWVVSLTKQGNSGATINRKCAALSKLLTFAFRRGKLTAKPYIQRQREGEGRKRYLSLVEESNVLQLLQEHELAQQADVVQVLIDTGLRPSELWRLTAKDCDFEHDAIYLDQTKNDKPRAVPMVQRVRAILYRRVTDQPTGLLFPFSNAWLLTAWNRVKAEMGLSLDAEFVPYALRHTCASRLGQGGVDSLLIQAWLGHKSLTMTKRYTHYNTVNLSDAAKVLESLKSTHLVVD